MKSPERMNGATAQLPAPAPITIPIVCPACQSQAILTKARDTDTDAYWRCTRCGEVWNASRRHHR